MSQNESSQIWFLSGVFFGGRVMVMNKKVPKWRHKPYIDIACYFAFIHGWTREGEWCSFPAGFNRSVVLKHVLNKEDIWTQFYLNDFAWEYGLIHLVIYWNMPFVGRKEGGSTSWCEDQKEDAGIGLKRKQVAVVSWAAMFISLDFIDFLPLTERWNGGNHFLFC